MKKQTKQEEDLLQRLEKSNEAFINARASRGEGCAKCNWRGYIVDENEKATNCECWFKRTITRRCLASGIPASFIGMTLEDNWNLKQDANNKDIGIDSEIKLRVKRKVAQYIKNIVPLCAGLKLTIGNTGTEVQNLIFVGESRSGKTLLASIIAQEAIKKGLVTEFISWIDIEPIFSDFNAREEQNSIVEACKDADLVIIDGVQFLNLNNSYYLSGLERIASARINSGQPTIITAFEDYTNIKGRHNWTSLIDSCFKIYLPAPKKDKD